MTASQRATPAWTQGGPEEVAEGIFRIPLPLPGDALRAVNAYLVAGEGGDLLVDTGWASDESYGALESGLATLGRRPEGIRQVLATHVHGDHLGAAGRVRQSSGAVVSLGRGDRESALVLALQPQLARERTLARLRQNGAGDVAGELEGEGPGAAAVGPPLPLPDLYLSGGELLEVGGRHLEVLSTPGHTRGHLCLLDRDAGVLLAGDHVLPHITPSVGVEVDAPPSALGDFLESLRWVRSLEAPLVLPAHGPAFTGLQERVDELLEHHRERLLLSQDAVERGAHSAGAVACALPWTRRQRRLSELDPFNQMLAVGETLAHLELLVSESRLERRLTESGVEFAPANADAQEALP